MKRRPAPRSNRRALLVNADLNIMRQQREVAPRPESGLDGVEKRVGRRHALLGPLRQAITAGPALLIWNVDRLRWPALHGLDLDLLALHGPVLQERLHGGSI